MTTNIYVSQPMNTPYNILREIIWYIWANINSSINISYWLTGDIYTTVEIDKADAVIIILPMQKWEMNSKDITNGVRSEIIRAYKHGKPIYLAYWPNKPDLHDKELKLYQTRIHGHIERGGIFIIGGITSSTNEAIAELKSIGPHEAKEVEPEIKTNGSSLILLLLRRKS